VFDEAGTGLHRSHPTNIIYQTQGFSYQPTAREGSPSDGAGASEAGVAHLGVFSSDRQIHVARTHPGETGNQDGASLISTVPTYVNEKAVAT